MANPTPERDYSGLAIGAVVVFLLLVGILSVSLLAKDFIDSASRDMSFREVPRCGYCAIGDEFVRSCSGGCDERV